MKVSKYNCFLKNKLNKEREEYIVYNSMSNILALIGEDQYGQYINFAENGVDIEDQELFESLKKGGIL